MNKRKLTVCVLLAAAILAAQTSCEIDGGIIGLLDGKTADTDGEEQVPDDPVISEPVPANLSADYDWAVSNAPDFTVSSAEELISAAYWVNHISEEPQPVTITLAADIDLSGYLWEPLGKTGTDAAGVMRNSFYGEIDGGGHTISHLKVREQWNAGFVGYAASLRVHDISFTDADISGNVNTGIVCGEKYAEDTWSNISVSGRITTDSSMDYGAIGGRTPDVKFRDCYADVTVNGEPFNYFSWKLYCEDNNAHADDYSLIYDSATDTISRSRRDKEAENLLWVISRNGQRVLGRGCEDEYRIDPNSFDIVGGSTGLYSVYLEAFYNGVYLRCSNVCSYELVPPEWPQYCEGYDLNTDDPYEIQLGGEDGTDTIQCVDSCEDAGNYEQLFWVLLANGKMGAKVPFSEDEPARFSRLLFEANQNGVVNEGDNTADIFVIGERADGTVDRISNVIEDTWNYHIPDNIVAGTPAE